MTSYVLNETQAYKAMFVFLDNLFKLTNDESLAGILGSMQLLDDGKPIDIAYWVDWIQAIEKVLEDS